MSFLQRTLRLTRTNPSMLAFRQATPFTSQAKRFLSTDGGASPALSADDGAPPSPSTDAAPQAFVIPPPAKSTIPLVNIGKTLHPFPRGIFRHQYSPPVIPPFVLMHYNSEPFQWSWTIKAGPNAGKIIQVPTVPIACDVEASPAVKWTVKHFDAFKAHLAPTVFVNGRIPEFLIHIYANNMVFQLRHQLKLYFASKAASQATEDTL